jgi:hypothetical protein
MSLVRIEGRRGVESTPSQLRRSCRIGLSLPLAPPATRLHGAKTRDVVGRDAHRGRAQHSEKIRGRLTIPSCGGDRRLVRKYISYTITRVQQMVLLAAETVNPPQVSWRIGFDLLAEEGNFLGVTVKSRLRSRINDF